MATRTIEATLDSFSVDAGSEITYLGATAAGNPGESKEFQEVWEIIGSKSYLANESWPKINEKYLQDETVVIPIQVNGKRRAEILVDKNTNENEILNIAISHEKIKKNCCVIIVVSHQI